MSEEHRKYSAARAAAYNSDAQRSIRAADRLGMTVHAYIPMGIISGRSVTLEDPPTAYVNQMDAKRVCDRIRKRHKRGNPNTLFRTYVQGVNLK